MRFRIHVDPVQFSCRPEPDSDGELGQHGHELESFRVHILDLRFDGRSKSDRNGPGGHEREWGRRDGRLFRGNGRGLFRRGSTTNNIGGGSNGGNNSGNYIDNCAVNGNGLTTLNTGAVTYLLFGASVASGQSGQDFFKIQDISFSPAFIGTPEPATFGLIGLSLAGLGLLRRKRRRE